MTRTPTLQLRNRGSIATLLSGCCFLLLFVCTPVRSAGLVWSPATGIPAQVVGATFSSVRFLNGQFYAVTSNGAIISTPDGANWNLRNPVSAPIFQDIAWKSGAGYVAVGDNVVWFSSDGSTWIDTNLSSPLLKGVVANNSKFVAVGSFGRMWNSADGMNWTTSDDWPNSVVLQDVSWNGIRFVAVGQSGTVLVGDGTGSGSSSANILGAPTLHGVAFSTSLPVPTTIAVGQNGNIWASDADALNWQPVADFTNGSLPNILFSAVTEGNGQFVAVGDKETIMSSVDGQSWLQDNNGPNALSGVAWGNGRFIAVGDAGTVLVGLPSVSVTSEALNGGVPVPSVAVGTAYKYRITVTNNSGTPVSNLSFTDSLDPNVTYTSISNPGVWSNCTAPPTSTIICQPATLPANSSVSVIVEVSAPSVVGTGKITNNVQLQSPDLAADVLDSLIIALTASGGGSLPPPLTGTGGGGGAVGYLMLIGLISMIGLSVNDRTRRAASVRTD